MRKEATKKQSKFKLYILIPIRILKKAKELYVKGVVDISGRIGYGATGSAVQISQCPAAAAEIKLNNASKKANSGDQRELFRTVQVPLLNETRLVKHGEERSMGSTAAVVMHRQRQRVVVGYRYNKRIKMSYYHSMGLTKMERIDEEKPCYFEEDGDYRSNLLYLYPRSRITRPEQ